MNVIYSGSRNLYPAMRGAMLSLLEHNPDVTIYVLAEDDELPFEIPAEHRIINVSGQTVFRPDGPNMRSPFTYLALMRVRTPLLLPDVDRVIQLDVDTIVCDSLKPIWEMDLEGKWLGWCPEQWGQWRPFGPKYYNFGVAVLNLKLMREHRAPDVLTALLEHNQLQFVDQDAMNYVAARVLSADLPVRYNESFCCGYTEHPAIVHYAGYPNWYTDEMAPRWWLREKYQKLADEVFGPEG